MRRLSINDRLLAVAAAIGIVSCYLTWSASDAAGMRIATSAFRTSPLGDIYFLAMLVVVAGILCRSELIWISRWSDRIGDIAAPVALVTVVLQVLVSLITHASLGLAVVPAALAAIAIEGLTLHPLGRRRVRRYGLN